MRLSVALAISLCSMAALAEPAAPGATTGLQFLPGRPAFSFNPPEGVDVVPVEAGHPDKKIVDEELAAILAMFNKNDPPDTIVKFYKPLEIQSGATTTVFPGYRFFLLTWEESDRDPNHHIVGRAAFPHRFLAVAPDGAKERIYDVPRGELLVEARARIRSQEDAELAWRALCELRVRGPGREKCEKMSETQWKLGLLVVEDHRGARVMRTTIHTAVTTDAEGVVIAAKRHSDAVIANADPAIRKELTVRVPTKFSMNGSSPLEVFHVSIGRSGKKVNVTVGANMVTGVKTSLYLYVEGEERPAKAYKEVVTLDTNFIPTALRVDRRRDGFAQPGKKYVVEVESELFETDRPYESPPWKYEGGKYNVLWKQSLKQVANAMK
ncbi:MAG: hypothetical protein ABI680_03175 [Chthoniobacteraceae bacterium]